jgi:alkanesulfonate monooxygenase SsuD/methylene tetrahydromethanopterin reductase-like flavin-dependent oxidoreductase (luciferase family)
VGSTSKFGFRQQIRSLYRHYGIIAPNFGEYSDPRLLAELAREAEAAGWAGFFLWDHITWSTHEPVVDPWVTLAAMALRTTHIRLGRW